jgi:hypothetical protein
MNKDNLKSDIKYNFNSDNPHYHLFHDNPSPVAFSKAKESTGGDIGESEYIKMF